MLIPCLLGLLAWGFLLGVIRDQDGPYFFAKPEGDNKWKEAGMFLWTLPLNFIVSFYYPITLLNIGLGATMVGLGALVWTGPHAVLDSFRSKEKRAGNGTGLSYSPNRFGVYEIGECYVNLALGGALLGLGTSIFLAGNAHYVMSAANLLLCAIYKPLAYRLAWAKFGHSSGGPWKYQHPTFWGHAGHFALTVATCGAFLYLGA